MPRKKKEETATASPKPKRALKVKPASKTAKAPAKKTTALKTTKTAGVKRAPKALKAVSPQKTETASSKKMNRKGETQMLAFIRDPRCIFTYWEVTPESIAAVKQQLMDEYKGSSMVLRVFRTGPDGQAELIQEIKVEPDEMNRYVELGETTGSYFIEIAQKTASGKTVVYARSNRVVTGLSVDSPMGASHSSDPKWEMPAGLLEYYSEEIEHPESLSRQGQGISSAEAHRKALLRKKMDRYSASRMS